MSSKKEDIKIVSNYVDRFVNVKNILKERIIFTQIGESPTATIDVSFISEFIHNVNQVNQSAFPNNFITVSNTTAGDVAYSPYSLLDYSQVIR